jgi:hypothetical protein
VWVNHRGIASQDSDQDIIKAIPHDFGGKAMNTKSFYFLAATSLALTGCGLNAIRVQTASEVGAASTAISGAAKQQLENMSRLREQAFISLVASDASCEYNTELQVFIPQRPGLPPAPLCAKDINDTRVGYDNRTINFAPVPAQALAPTLELIGAVAAYGEALTKITEQPEFDISDDIAEAIGLATRAQALAAGLGSSGIPEIGDITTDQQQTATDLINFLGMLAQEKRQVKDIRAIVKKHGANFVKASERLKKQITTWNKAVSSRSAILNRDNLKSFYRSERSRLSYEAREKLLRLIANADKEDLNIRSGTAAFNKAVDGMLAAQSDLETALSKNPNEVQRKEAAKISRTRFVNAFKLAVDALLAWKVI